MIIFKRFRIFSVLLLGMGFFSGCKSTQTIVAPNTASKPFGIVDFPFEELSIKSKLLFVSGSEETKANAHIQIRKDSAIWVSISKNNVEGARLLVTPDSLQMIDRINKVYYAYNYAQLQEKFGFAFSYRMMEAVLTGNLYRENPSLPLPAPTQLDTTFLLKEQIQELSAEHVVGQVLRKLLKTQVLDKQQNMLSIAYQNFVEVNGYAFPHLSNTAIDYQKNGVRYATQLELEHTKVEIPDKPFGFNFKINPKYERRE